MLNYFRIQTVIVAALCAASATGARAAVSSMEDLSACKLPNGVATLPLPGSRQAQGGTVFNLATGTLGQFPVAENGQVLAPAQILEKLRTQKTSDLLFLPDALGSLWAVSGRISELGSGYLSDVARRPLAIPMEIPATSRTPAGMFPGVAEGRVYVIQTTEQRFALVRVLEKSPAGLVIQYIYQPSGALAFDVPKADLLDYHHPAMPGDAAAATTAPAGSPAAALGAAPGAVNPADQMAGANAGETMPLRRPVLGPGDQFEPGIIVMRSTTPAPSPPGTPLAPAAPTLAAAADNARPAGPEGSLEAFSRQRDQMIQSRMAIVAAPAQTRAEIEKKTQAIFELATYLHADQAADLFVSQITFLNTGSTAREFSQDATLPCFSALKHMGKPASAAALRGLEQLNMDQPGEAIDTPKYRADLLGAVIRAVEGDDVANFMLHREMENQTDPKKRAIFEYLVNKN